MPGTGAVIAGPAGNDWYVGDSANNTPSAAGGGADIMYGAEGDDTLQGGSGNDILVGYGNDTISGNSDDDVILGGAGNDYLDGGSSVGKNTIIGGGGNDQMIGGLGADVFRFTGAQSGDAYTVDGGGGTDIIDLSEFSTATITNSGGVITVDRGSGNVFTITHSNVESIITAATVGNHGPLADAGVDQTVAMSATVTLTAAGSSDRDGNSLTYQWTQIEGPKVTLSSSTARFTEFFTAPGSATTLQFVVVVSDGTTSHADTVTISVGVVNSAPTVSNLSGDTLNYTEDSGAVVIDQGANALVTDSDSANFDTGNIDHQYFCGSRTDGRMRRHSQSRLRGWTDRCEWIEGDLRRCDDRNLYRRGRRSNLVITFNSNATPTAVTALVKNITYENINTDSPIQGSCTIRFALTDGDGGTSANYDVSAWITGVNDAPLNSVPGSQSTNEDTNLIFSSGNGNQISITGSSNSGASFEATISVTNGTLTLAGTTGVTFVTGDGTADTTMTIRGTVANIMQRRTA